MDTKTFDAIARTLGTTLSRRRTVQSLLGTLLTGGTLGGLVARLGPSETAEAKATKKRRRHQPGAKSQTRGELRTEGKRNKKRKNKPKPKKRCDDFPVPLCPDCQEPRCDTATGKWVCHNTCPEGWSCCNGQCWEPCVNGCVEDPSQECTCQTPPTDEDVYCALEHLCGPDPCPPGKEYVSSTCTCRDKPPGNCGTGWEWCNGDCRETEFGPWTPCGNTCCRASDECCNGFCFDRARAPWIPCGDFCCTETLSVCCNGECYPKDTAPRTPCGDVCCLGNYDQCCGGEFCCAKDAVCCPNRCCPRGYTCCGDSCCRDD